MSGTTILVIAIPVLVVLAAVVLVTTARRGDTRRGAGALSRETVRRDRSDLVGVAAQPATGREIERAAAEARSTSTDIVPASALPPAPYVPPDEETVGVTRRQFFNRGMVILTLVGISGFGAAVLGFLWPKLGGGFGSKINAGRLDEVIANIRSNSNFYYLAEARTWLTEYPADALTKAQAVYTGAVLTGMEGGINALYQKCPHLGCRVPQCDSSQWFECPCHGSQYNQVGEKKGGPAPRGMDRFGVAFTGGNVIVDTGNLALGPPIGTNTTGQEAEGPHCISAAGGGH